MTAHEWKDGYDGEHFIYCRWCGQLFNERKRKNQQGGHCIKGVKK